MSLFKFGNYEREIDFTDADILERIDRGNETLQKEIKELPLTGKNADLIRAQNRCYDHFFDIVLGNGASKKMFDSQSLAKRIEAASKFADAKIRADNEFNEMTANFRVNKPVNRQQRRYADKQNRKHMS